LQGKEYSRNGPTIRIRVNLQGMDLSRKSRTGIRKEQYLQRKEFARNGLCKECGLCCVYHSSVGGSIWSVIPVYRPMSCENFSSLAFSVACKFRTLPKTTTFFPLAANCKFNSLQIPFLTDSISLQIPFLAISFPCKLRRPEVSSSSSR